CRLDYATFDHVRTIGPERWSPLNDAPDLWKTPTAPITDHILSNVELDRLPRLDRSREGKVQGCCYLFEVRHGESGVAVAMANDAPFSSQLRARFGNFRRIKRPYHPFAFVKDDNLGLPILKLLQLFRAELAKDLQQ